MWTARETTTPLVQCFFWLSFYRYTVRNKCPYMLSLRVDIESPLYLLNLSVEACKLEAG